jgi:hypothetical protein
MVTFGGAGIEISSPRLTVRHPAQIFLSADAFRVQKAGCFFKLKSDRALLYSVESRSLIYSFFKACISKKTSMRTVSLTMFSCITIFVSSDGLKQHSMELE